MLICCKSTTTPKKGGLNGDPKRVLDKTMLTAETQRTQSLLFDLFSFERKENRYQQALRRYSHSIHNCVISMTRYYLHCHHAVRSFLFWPLSRKENIYSLCELCVSSEAGGEKHSRTYPHSKAGTIPLCGKV